MEDDDDPTCIVNMLEEFRGKAANYHRSSMLSLNVFGQDNASSSKPKRLRFDVGGDTDVSDKRQRIETPKSKDFTDDVMSPWEIRRIKSEVMKTRAQVIELEERIAKSDALNVEMGLRHREEKKILMNNLDEERTKVKELESRLSFIRKREAEAVDRYNQLKLGENEKENSACKLLSQLQKENHYLKEKIFEFENEAKAKKKEENDEIRSLNVEINHLKDKVEMQRSNVEELTNTLREKNEELRKLEMEQTNILSVMKRVKDLESEREAYLETRTYVESQNKKLQRFSNLEKEIAEMKEENKRLKTSISNVLFLETQVDHFKTRIEQVDKLDQELTKLRTENQNYRIELENWLKFAKRFCAPDDNKSKPLILLQRFIDELLKKELCYVDEKNKAELRINHLEENISELEKELTKSKEQINYLKTSCETHASNIRRLKKQLTLVSWERNDLRNLLDSCQKDMTMVSETHSQFEALQKVIDGYKERLEQIESDPSIATFSGTDGRDDLSRKKNILEEENKKLQERVQHLSDQLEYRHLKGDFDPRQTKIVHLKTNPTSEAMKNYDDQLTKANEEIFRLKERIKVMEEGNNEDVTRIVEERVQTTSIKEVTELKERAKSLEIQNQRLCEVFRKRSHDFRDAMYILFGYKVDVLPNNQYRLCSLYAFDPQDILMFQISQSSSGAMELLETPYSQSISELIDLHLTQHKSIPLFLASLTIDLFNKQTMTSFSTTIETTICDN